MIHDTYAQPADTNWNGLINGDDVQPFVECLCGGGTNCHCADLDGGGVGTGDVAMFISVLLQP